MEHPGNGNEKSNSAILLHELQKSYQFNLMIW